VAAVDGVMLAEGVPEAVAVPLPVQLPACGRRRLGQAAARARRPRGRHLTCRRRAGRRWDRRRACARSCALGLGTRRERAELFRPLVPHSPDAVPVKLAVPAPLADVLGVCDPVAVPVAAPDPEAVPASEGEVDGVTALDAAALPVPVAVDEPVAVALSLLDGLPDCVSDCEADGLQLVDGDVDAERLGVGVGSPMAAFPAAAMA
jgi:hypothetical protein